MVRATAILALVILSAFFLWFASNPFNRAALFGSGGRSETTAHFGIAIGMPSEAASAILAENGFGRDQPQNAGRCLGRDFAEAQEQLELWRDRSWRRATICIGTRDGRVRSLVWSFGPWMP